MPPTDDELWSAATLEELQSGRSLMDGFVPNLPAPVSNRTSFALGSCQYPGGFVDEAVAYRSYRDLAQRLDSDDGGPRFVVLTGDQVYTDATAGILDPSIADGRYTLPYHRWLRSRAVRSALRQAHSYMLLDDHEIENDWEEDPPNPSDRLEMFRTAIRSYMQFERNEAQVPPERYFNFTFDDFEFFMLDTRSGREPRDLSNTETAHILDIPEAPANLADPDIRVQFQDFLAWLGAAPLNRPKFVVSPSMILPRHREAASWGHAESAMHSDGWDGYPFSLHEMLVTAKKSNTEHIVFLSGDEHFGCIATITVKDLTDSSEKTFYSIHSPGLYTPYAFANSGEMDWLPENKRPFTHEGTDFEYTVTYVPFTGEGFAYIDVAETDTGWHLSCQFGDGTVHPVF